MFVKDADGCCRMQQPEDRLRIESAIYNLEPSDEMQHLTDISLTAATADVAERLETRAQRFRPVVLVNLLSVGLESGLLRRACRAGDRHRFECRVLRMKRHSGETPAKPVPDSKNPSRIQWQTALARVRARAGNPRSFAHQSTFGDREDRLRHPPPRISTMICE